MPQQQIQTGSGVVVKVNGKVVGFATGLTFTRSQNLKVIHEVDSPFAAEIAPTTYSVSGNMTGFRLRDSGGLDGAGKGNQIMDLSTVDSYFYQKYATIEVVDRVSNKMMYSFRGVLFDQDSWSITTKNIITFSASFRAIFVSNEASTAQ